MEERYVNMSRRPQGRREAPPRQRPAGGWDDPPRRRTASAKPRRSPLKSAALGIYKVLVVLSAIVVAVYLGVTLMIKAPEQNQNLPNGGGNITVPVVDGNGGVSTVDPDGQALERRPGVYTIFLAATDLEGYRTDTMMLMTYDTKAQTVGVVSIPRDTLVARAKGSNPRLVYGKGGVEQRAEDVSDMLGVPIDFYVKVNIKGFITLVDYLKGIDFYIPCNMDYDDDIQDLHIHYKTGQTHLNGQQAMEVARFRKNNDGSGYSDIGRTQTQQQILVALAKKVLSWGNLTRINGFVEIFNDNVDTDLELSEMLYFASQAVNLDPSSGVETATLPGRGDGVYHGTSYCYELDREETLEVVNRLINPYTQTMTLDNMNLAKAERYMS